MANLDENGGKRQGRKEKKYQHQIRRSMAVTQPKVVSYISITLNNYFLQCFKYGVFKNKLYGSFVKFLYNKPNQSSYCRRYFIRLGGVSACLTISLLRFYQRTFWCRQKVFRGRVINLNGYWKIIGINYRLILPDHKFIDGHELKSKFEVESMNMVRNHVHPLTAPTKYRFTSKFYAKE